MTPDTSRATTPVGDVEAFDPFRPSVRPGDSILLTIGKVPSYLDMTPKALTSYRGANLFHHVRSLSPLFPIP